MVNFVTMLLVYICDIKIVLFQYHKHLECQKVVFLICSPDSDKNIKIKDQTEPCWDKTRFALRTLPNNKNLDGPAHQLNLINMSVVQS